ncbi:MAG: hypothetical protein MJE77_42020 [Proteobacteria bacterium]|nr:hypothetical protein [Pseudomonadota bacterium]
MSQWFKKLALVTALAVIALAVLSASAPLTARANDCDEESSDKNDGGKFHIEERNGQKVYVIDKVITVCGKVPRPLVAYVLQARTINYKWETLKQDFLPKVLDSVKKAPF